MKLDILTPEQILFSGEVNMVTVPGTKGLFTIKQNHAPIISSLKKGVITYRTMNNEETNIETTGGFVEMNNNVISICIETADNA